MSRALRRKEGTSKARARLGKVRYTSRSRALWSAQRLNRDKPWLLPKTAYFCSYGNHYHVGSPLGRNESG